LLQSPEFASYAVTLDKWQCERDSCVANLRLLVTPGNPGQNHTTASEMMTLLQGRLRPLNTSVGLTQIQHTAQGTEIGFAFTTQADTRGRFYTDEEIAKIRSDTIQSYEESLNKQPPNLPKSVKS
jgi:hypothetical protein